MALEIANAEKELFELIIYGHIDYDFEPISDYALNLFGYPMDYPFPKDKDTRKKLFLSDIDGVWNVGDPIFLAYLKKLGERNTGIKDEFYNIREIIKDIKPGYVDEPVSHINEIFRACDVRKRQHDWACEHVIDDIDIVPYGRHCVAELKSMHYEIYCFSGSPDKAVKLFVKERLSLKDEREGIEDSEKIEYGYGSVYKFESEDRDAKFVSIDPLLYEYKRPVVEKILKETTGSIKSLNMVLSDEPGDIKMVCSFVAPFIAVGHIEELPDEKECIFLKLPEFRDDARTLPPLLKKIERALCLYFGYTKEEKERIFYSALGFKKCSELIRRTEDEDLIRDLKMKKLEYFNEYKFVARKIFSLFLSKIENLADELESATTIDEIKSTSNNFWNKFKELSPDADIAEAYYAKI